MTLMKMKKARGLAGVVVAVAGFCTIGAAACQVDVISGDDGDGGQGGQGGAGVVVVGTTAGYTVATGDGTTNGGTTHASQANSVVYTTAVGSTAGSGMCPPTPQWPSDCATVGATAAGTGGGLKYCHWEQQDCAPNEAITIACDEATGLCTCTGSGESCFCNWNVPPEGGACGSPCCGGNPSTFP